jgi:hypothetical protein
VCGMLCSDIVCGMLCNDILSMLKSVKLARQCLLMLFICRVFYVLHSLLQKCWSFALMFCSGISCQHVQWLTCFDSVVLSVERNLYPIGTNRWTASYVSLYCLEHNRENRPKNVWIVQGNCCSTRTSWKFANPVHSASQFLTVDIILIWSGTFFLC